MAKYGSDDAFILVDGYDLTGFSTEFTDTKEAQLEETHTLGDAWVENAYVGVKSANIQQSAFYDDAALATSAALVSSVGSTRVLSYGLEGNTIGKKMLCYQGALQTNVSRVVTRGELHKVNVQYQGSGQVSETVILHDLSAETADGDTEAESYDGAAQSASGGVAFLQVTALDLDGYDDVTITVVDDADNVGPFGSLVAFTNVSTAPTAERVTVAGTVERYLAVSWAFNGTGTSPSISFIVGFERS